MLEPNRLHDIHASGLATRTEIQQMAGALLKVASRRADPETSHAAADTVNLTANRVAVLAVMREMTGPWSDEQLVSAYRSKVCVGMVPPQSDSGIRSRRAELQRMGFCSEWDTVQNSRKRPVRRWQTCYGIQIS